MKFLSLLLLFSFLSGCAGDSDNDSNSDDRQNEEDTPASTAGQVSLWQRSNGYDAAVYLPLDYGTMNAKKYPVVISLYGLRGSVLNTERTEVGGEKSGFIKQVWGTALARTYPAIVIAPEVGVRGPVEPTVWNYTELVDLIEDALKTYDIDEKRVVVTGFSAGSAATQELALRSKDLIAGIMPGALEAVIKGNLCSVDDLPIWSFGNSSDQIFQPASWSGVKDEIKDCSDYTEEFKLSIRESDCGHGCWDQHWARRDVQVWLSSQVKR